MSAPSSNDRLGYDGFARQDWPFYWIVRASNAYSLQLENQLKSITLDVPKWRVLMLLETSAPRSVSFLATEGIIKLSTMTRIVQRMEQDGLVKTRPRPADKRVTEVMITTAGKKARKAAFVLAYEVFSKAFGDVPRSDIAMLNETLSHMLDNIQAPTSEDA